MGVSQSAEGIEHFIQNDENIAQFTTAPAVTSVPLSFGGSSLLSERGSLGNHFFIQDDNVLIESIIFKLPYCFSLGEENIAVTLGFRDRPNVDTGLLTSFGNGGQIRLTLENTEIPLNQNIQKPTTSAFDWGITLIALSTAVSMINSPIRPAGCVNIPLKSATRVSPCKSLQNH